VTCQETHQYLPDYVMGRLEEAQQASLAQHLATCQECAQARDDLTGLAPYYQFTEPQEPSKEFWNAYVADLQTRVETVEQRRAARSPVARSWHWVARHAWAASCAVVILAAVAVWGRYTGSGSVVEEADYAVALEFYLDQHAQDVAGKVLVESFPVQDAGQNIEFVSSGLD
jgi:anti-sigma factor RsiW